MEKQKLPKFDIGANNLYHLHDNVDVFLQIVAQNHQTDLTVNIQLSNTFMKKVQIYTEPKEL